MEEVEVDVGDVDEYDDNGGSGGFNDVEENRSVKVGLRSRSLLIYCSYYVRRSRTSESPAPLPVSSPGLRIMALVQWERQLNWT